MWIAIYIIYIHLIINCADHCLQHRGYGWRVAAAAHSLPQRHAIKFGAEGGSSGPDEAQFKAFVYRGTRHFTALTRLDLTPMRIA